MNHSKLAEKLSAYYDQRLTQPERWEMESHLEDCPSCRKTLREWQSASAFLFVKPRFSEWNEDIFTQRVMARLNGAPLSFDWKPLAQWSFPLLGSLIAAAWVWGAVLPNLPGLASDSSFINQSGPQLASTASLAAETAYSSAAPSNNLTVSLVSYDEGR